MSLSERAVQELSGDAAEPRDAVFERWAEQEGTAANADGFLWLPSRGMGRLPTSDPPYDADYFKNYLKLSRTPMGEALTKARVELVNRFHTGHVVDVGIGCGAFILARLGLTWGYDVNPAGIAWLREYARYRDPYYEPVTAVSLWDVLEHLPEPARLLANVRRFVFMSLPIVPDASGPPAGWRHYKPREHCWYWTRDGLVEWMACHGFRCVSESKAETLLGRQDIGSFAFQRGAL